MSEAKREEWLARRQSVIGASEIAALVGMNPYQTPIDIYLSKINPAYTDNPNMKMGRRLEPVILDMYSDETGQPVAPNSELLIHPTIPSIGCTPDGFVLAEERGLIEAKATKRHISSTADESHYIQLQYQLGVSGLTWGEIAYLSAGWEFHRFRFDRDDELVKALFEVAQDFWNEHVTRRIPPEPQSGDDASKIFRSHITGKMLEATPEVVRLIEQGKRKRDQLTELQREIDEIKDGLRLALRDAEGFVHNGLPLVTWKKDADGTTLDMKRLRTEQPELYESYLTTRPGQRKFLFK